MKFIELASNLKSKIETVYFISGQDSYLKQTAYKLIKKACLKDNFSDFNENFFDNENWNPEKFIEAINGIPLANNYKLIHIKNIEKLTEKDKQVIQSCINNIPSTTCLVIEISDALKNLNNGTIIDCNYLDHDTIVKYIYNEVLKNSKKIGLNAINLLIDYCSMNMTKITSEIPKIIAYCDDEEIDINIIKQLVQPDEEYHVFEFTEALGNKNKDKCIKILNLLLQKKENALLPLIINHFRRVAFCSLSDFTNEQLAEMFNVKPFAITKARNQSKYFSKIQLKNILNYLEEADYMTKSGAMQAENALYYLTFKILNS